LFYFSNNNYISAIKEFVSAINKNNKILFIWKKLLISCIYSGYHSQRINSYKQAISMPFWTNTAKAQLMEQGSALYHLHYDFDQAINIRREKISWLLTQPPLPVNLNIKPDNFDSSKAWKTLIDLLALLESYQLKPFPTSGTLLGWQREGDILYNDNDIDIALVPDDDINLAKKIIFDNPRYKLNQFTPKTSSYFAMTDQLTGIAVDILGMWENNNSFEYGWLLPGQYKKHSRILILIFTPFTLIQDQWNKQTFWRPENVHLFLTELYGDWRTPDSLFDGTISSCNLNNLPTMVQATAYNKIIYFFKRAKYKKVLTLTQALIDRGDNHKILPQLKSCLLKELDEKP